jgi:hypothetical protein
MRAVCMIRESLHYKRESFMLGLRKAGYDVVPSIYKPTSDDVLVIWQRYGYYHELAQHFEKGGARVLVVENGYLGKQWGNEEWFAMAEGHHAGAGRWHQLDNDRWDSLQVQLEPWRTGGTETVILAQRGIGETGIASPGHWAENTQIRLRTGRIRGHPGNKEAEIPLADDLQKASSVVTWASSAALRALLMGIPVWYEFPRWIGSMASKPVSQFGSVEPLRNDNLRLQMFRRMIWAQWRLTEIRSGWAFQTLLNEQKAVA